MPEMSFGKIVLLMLVALLVFGAKKIPEIGQGLGKGIREFKKSLTDTQDALNAPVHDDRAPGPQRIMDAEERQAAGGRRAEAIVAVTHRREDARRKTGSPRNAETPSCVLHLLASYRGGLSDSLRGLRRFGLRVGLEDVVAPIHDLGRGPQVGEVLANPLLAHAADRVAPQLVPVLDERPGVGGDVLQDPDHVEPFRRVDHAAEGTLRQPERGAHDLRILRAGTRCGSTGRTPGSEA